MEDYLVNFGDGGTSNCALGGLRDCWGDGALRCNACANRCW